MSRKRLTREERKKEIQAAALQLFTQKGYQNTSMQDLALASGLSIGGLYHHYKSCSEVLYDLMVLGNAYREEKMQEAAKRHDKAFSYDFFVDLIADKCLDENPFMPVYVMFLQSIPTDQRLRSLFLKLKSDSIEQFKVLLQENLCAGFSDEHWDFLTDYINSIILGCELIGARDSFKKNKNTFKRALLQILQAEQKG